MTAFPSWRRLHSTCAGGSEGRICRPPPASRRRGGNGNEQGGGLETDARLAFQDNRRPWRDERVFPSRKITPLQPSPKSERQRREGILSASDRHGDQEDRVCNGHVVDCDVLLRRDSPGVPCRGRMEELGGGA